MLILFSCKKENKKYINEEKIPLTDKIKIVDTANNNRHLNNKVVEEPKQIEYNQLEFKSSRPHKSGVYSLLKLVYLPDNDDLYLEFVDTTSVEDSKGKYQITYQVYSDHLSFDENKLKFYGHSGELGEVQAELDLKTDTEGKYIRMEGSISFLSSTYKNVKFVRTTTSY